MILAYSVPVVCSHFKSQIYTAVLINENTVSKEARGNAIPAEVFTHKKEHTHWSNLLQPT